MKEEKSQKKSDESKDTSNAEKHIRDFLTSLFKCPSENNKVRCAGAISDVHKVTLDVESSPLTVQSHITEIFTTFVLQSQGGANSNVSCRLFNFIDYSDVAGCREEEAIEFLLASFARCNDELEKDNLPSNSKLVLEVTKTAVLSVFVEMQRGYFDDQLQRRRASLVFVKRLLDDTISFNFIKDLIEYTANEEECDEKAAAEVFNPIFDILRAGAVAQHFEQNQDDIVQQILRVMNLLLNIRIAEDGSRPLSILLVDRPDFLPKIAETMKGREFGLMTYLGPFFNYGLESSGRRPNNRVFVGSEEDARKNDGLKNLEQQRYTNRMSSIRSLLHQMVLPLVSDLASKKKHVEMYDPANVIGDHFMTNFLSVMYRFSEKIDISKIIMEYPFLPGTLVDITKETRIRMDEQSALAFAAQFAERPVEYHFSTVCFFLTIAAQQLVIPPLIRQISKLTRHVKDLEQTLAAMREQLNTLTGIEKSQLEQEINSEKAHWQLMCRHLLCLKTHAQDPAILASVMDFVNKQMKLVMNSLCANLDMMGDDSQLPAEPTALFCAYPENYLEDVFDFFIFAIGTSPELMLVSNTNWISCLTVLFTRYEYINSPFLVAKLVRVLAAIEKPLWFHVVSLRMTQEKLLLCMIKFYSEFEDRGEFYEKFNVRGNIQYMFEKMADDAFYKTKSMNMARDCGIEFIRFVNMVINDATWCIDETLSGLKRIHEIEMKMAEKEEWDRNNWETRTQELGHLEKSKKNVLLWLGTAKKNLELILAISNNTPVPFQVPALGERLAAMLNHNMSQLLGTNSERLKVRNPGSYGWQPKIFVNLIVSIYLGLSVPAFVKYIAYDERTYNPEFFQNVIERMRKRKIVRISQLERFKYLAEDVKKEYAAKAELEEEYDDVPEEFKDPIMDAIMVDPVRLPSGHVLDRAVIERHLLSTPNNPFNRAPLESKQLVPDEELKAKINEWIVQKRNSRKV
uniref:RING-type E3 ubiquitin transferase n=1 Tax=Caenorhabditis tropicalis TaxID=1561998 RepID=A0A1I7TLD7_9PELO